MTDNGNPVDILAEDIRRVDGNHDLGAGRLAEKLTELGYTKYVPTDNQKLLEEAVKAIREAGNAGGAYAAARAAFAVFEKAHTPTDDEREALIECIEAVPLNQGALPRCEAAQIADAVLDALRRAEPHPLDALQDGTPSTRRAIAHAKARERLAVPQGEPSEAPCIEGGHANCERRTIDGESWTIHHPAATGQVHNAGQHAPGIDAVEDCPVCSPAVTQQGENR